MFCSKKPLQKIAENYYALIVEKKHVLNFRLSSRYLLHHILSSLGIVFMASGVLRVKFAFVLETKRP